MKKEEISAILEEIGFLLELKGENPFKVRAYYNAARALEALEGSLGQVVQQGELRQIKGIGEALNKKISELVTTGSLPYYEELKAAVPAGLREMVRIPQLGPKKIKALYERLGITTVGELEYACQENRLVDLPGFGAKTQENILQGIEVLKRYRGRFLYGDVAALAEAFTRSVAEVKGVLQASLAGSMRRKNEVVKDMDLVIAAQEGGAIGDGLIALPQIEEVLAQGETEIRVRLASGIPADLRMVSLKEFPFALHHLTGSKEHNIALRGRAKKMGMKINEYGLFAGERSIPCQGEEEIYRALGLAFIPPELREGRGEVEAAAEGRLPDLLNAEEIKGAFHVHTATSDGSNTISSLTKEAQRLGLSYLGITDHSRSAAYAGGLSEGAVKRQLEEIDEINRSSQGFRFFKGIEVEILSDGSLDYSDEVLAGFDFVIGAIHSHFQMEEKEMTQRIIHAMETRHLTMLAHPTGRLLLAREPYQLNMEEVINAAARLGVVLELNANPHRLDLDWRWLKYAKDHGTRISINPDAHNLQGLQDLLIGVGIARKGWLESRDVINTMELGEVARFLTAAQG
ncbi:MAG: DNA polymerase/3'-5' exonuclease PolX [Deltaproteobacteria bacterium]|nr:DNA polymerase/3'-5' exonuclease PolX [Deltaproteobacteria bacterium]